MIQRIDSNPCQFLPGEDSSSLSHRRSRRFPVHINGILILAAGTDVVALVLSIALHCFVIVAFSSKCNRLELF